MQNNVVIVAGGKGLRVGGELPKQFIPIGNKPVLMHTISAFYEYDSSMHIVLVLPQSHKEYWLDMCEEYKFDIPHQIAVGGKTRFHSVKNGLSLVKEGLVGIHDGARPFVDNEVIDRCYQSALVYRAVIPVIDATDSLREVLNGGNSQIIDRAKIRMVQTPQVFSVEVLKKAYETEYKDSFTDDASVVEMMGVTIHLVEGSQRNIKITRPIDLEIAELLLAEI